MSIETLKLALEALEADELDMVDDGSGNMVFRKEQAITSLRQAIAEAEKKEQVNPVAWLITDKNINSLQVKSIQTLIDRARHAHHTDICLRINGQDERYEADWLKHMVKATPQLGQT